MIDLIDTALINKYQDMADLTNPKCENCISRLGSYSCCSRPACEMALHWTREKWNVDLRHLFKNKAKIPFLNLTGCKLAPHFRPQCTVYTCAIHAFGYDKDEEWNYKYWKLRAELDNLEWHKFDSKLGIKK